MNLYDCDFCINNESYTGRACYLQEWPGQETFKFDVPVFDEGSTIPVGGEERFLDKDQLLEELDGLENIFPDAPPFELLRTWFNQPKEACPTSLVEPHYNFLLETESACREYNILPFAGGLWDQPQVLLEVFNTIRAERNQFDRIRIERMKSKKTVEVKPK